MIRNLIKIVGFKIIFIFLTLNFSTCFAKENLSLNHHDLMINLEGDFIQGGLVKGQTNKNITIKFKDKILRKTSNGEFVIGFGRDHPANAYLTLEINNKLITKSFKIKKRIYKTQKINGLRKKMVTPPKSFYERIIRENKSIKEVRNLNSNVDFVFQKFSWPTKGVISGVFGSQRILNGKPKRPHYGIDIAAKKGATVVTPTESIVRMAEKDLYYTGGTIMLDHGHGLTSVYSHLSSINVKVGDKILKNQKIGEVGSTGRSTGPHLDWRVNWFDQRLDPLLLLENK
ncbi:M23 family metallopeptidase [Alphaproteobacteria bacterium]|nr:M23 family metallopeptidase [Alphaproteobacteria bacterium]